MKKMLVVFGAAALLALPMVATAGIQGDCVDCHTMHNSEQGVKVAVAGLTGSLATTANQNLLRMDCIACHAQDAAGAESVVTLPGGSDVPQVYHAGTDLAAGNFKHLADGGDRKGHNVSDLFAVDGANAYAAPGDVRTHNFGAGTANTAFTCAGAVGCHGTRAQLVSGYTNDNGTPADPLDDSFVAQKRQGIAAVTGAHHANSADQLKDAAQNALGKHSGANVAAGYRFIPGLKGLGNEVDGWQNASSASHNEYFGSNVAGMDVNGCDTCHVPSADVATVPGASSRMNVDSTLLVPNQSMSGFCVTCHGNFHSSGGGDYTGNGTSGAFLRHPSDYVIPSSGEYAAYTTYNVTAPVARPTLATAVSASVTPGTDLVMCLSCHVAHASPNAGMLRFDYAVMTAGGYADSATAQAQGGCMACHTTKGVTK